jgi:hypothetical protein
MKNSYLVLTVILVILSLVGAIFLVKNKPQIETQIVDEQVLPTDIPVLIPTEVVEPTIVASASPTLKPTATSSATTPVPTPAFQTFSSSQDKFSVIYNSSRKLYQDTESSGNRYTFYLSTGNIALHVGTQWSWTHPDRALNPTFIYETATQKIVDMESNGLKYTIQCVHNGLSSLKTECDQFIADFKTLSP